MSDDETTRRHQHREYLRRDDRDRGNESTERSKIETTPAHEPSPGKQPLVDAAPSIVREPGKQTLVEASLSTPPLALSTPGKRTLTEEHGPAAVETPGVFDAQVTLARAEMVAFADANAARDVQRSCECAARLRHALDLAAYMLSLADQQGDETIQARRATLAEVEAAAKPLFDAGFTPSRAALDEVRGTRAFERWDADVRAWKGKVEPTRAAADATKASASEPRDAAPAGGPEGAAIAESTRETSTPDASGPANANRAATKVPARRDNDPRRIAARGIAGLGERLPFFDLIQASFGRHDLSGVRAHVGGAAGRAARQLGARAFAFGNHIAFDGMPDLHTAAHEAAHHVQQRAGVALKGGIDQAGDEYEAHADAVADAVVRGDSAEPLLDQQAGRGASASLASPTVVQRKAAGASSASGPGRPGPTPPVEEVMAIERQVGRLLDGIRAQLVLVGMASDLKPAYDARAERVATLADGDSKTRSTWLQVLQFQHAQLVAIAAQISPLVQQLQPLRLRSLMSAIEPSARAELELLQQTLTTYVRAAAVSHLRDQSTTLLRGIGANARAATAQSARQAPAQSEAAQEAVARGKAGMLHIRLQHVLNATNDRTGRYHIFHILEEADDPLTRKYLKEQFAKTNGGQSLESFLLNAKWSGAGDHTHAVDLLSEKRDQASAKLAAMSPAQREALEDKAAVWANKLLGVTRAPDSDDSEHADESAAILGPRSPEELEVIRKRIREQTSGTTSTTIYEELDRTFTKRDRGIALAGLGADQIQVAMLQLGDAAAEGTPERVQAVVKQLGPEKLAKLRKINPVIVGLVVGQMPPDAKKQIEALMEGRQAEADGARIAAMFEPVKPTFGPGAMPFPSPDNWAAFERAEKRKEAQAPERVIDALLQMTPAELEAARAAWNASGGRSIEEMFEARYKGADPNLRMRLHAALHGDKIGERAFRMRQGMAKFDQRLIDQALTNPDLKSADVDKRAAAEDERRQLGARTQRLDEDDQKIRALVARFQGREETAGPGRAMEQQITDHYAKAKEHDTGPENNAFASVMEPFAKTERMARIRERATVDEFAANEMWQDGDAHASTKVRRAELDDSATRKAEALENLDANASGSQNTVEAQRAEYRRKFGREMLVKSEAPDLGMLGVAAKLSGYDPAVLAEEIRRGDMTDGELRVEHVRETGALADRTREQRIAQMRERQQLNHSGWLERSETMQAQWGGRRGSEDWLEASIRWMEAGADTNEREFARRDHSATKALDLQREAKQHEAAKIARLISILGKIAAIATMNPAMFAAVNLGTNLTRIAAQKAIANEAYSAKNDLIHTGIDAVTDVFSAGTASWSRGARVAANLGLGAFGSIAHTVADGDTEDILWAAGKGVLGAALPNVARGKVEEAIQGTGRIARGARAVGGAVAEIGANATIAGGHLDITNAIDAAGGSLHGGHHGTKVAHHDDGHVVRHDVGDGPARHYPSPPDESHRLPESYEVDERPAAVNKSSTAERADSPRADDTRADRLPRSDRFAVETDAKGRVAIVGDDAHLRAGAQRAQPEPGYIDVVVHADPDHFYIVRGGAEIAVSHRAVAKMLEKAGLKKPMKIRLLACEGGKSSEAVAQHLANKTGLVVRAATDKVWVDANGTVGVGARDRHEGGWVEHMPGTAVELLSKRTMVVPEEGGRRDPLAPDQDPVLDSQHDHRDRVEAWNHAQLQAQIGKPLVPDPTIGDGVRIKARKTAAGYEVSAIVYGPDARAVDVRRHADIVARVERYNGLVGKLRSWKDALFGPRAKHDYARGSRGDRLHLELEKLETHIRDTDILRSNDAVDAVRAKEEIAFLTDAVNEIRERLDDKHHDLHTQDPAFDIARPNEPLGYITEKAKAAGYKLPGEEGAILDGVPLNPADYYYRRRGDGFELARMPNRNVPQLEAIVDSAGNFVGIKPASGDRAPETKLIDLPYERAKELLFAPDASMDPYTQMLEHLQIATRADVDATARRLYEKQTMKGASTIDTWRKEIKKHYRKRVDERLYDPSLSDAESYRQLRDAVDLLANKDRANVVEGWYRARRLQGAEVRAQVEYTVVRSSGKAHGKSEKREADFIVSRDKVEGTEIVEIKDIGEKLDTEQFDAYVDAIRDDETRAKLGAERIRYVFTKEAGAKASLEFLAKAYAKQDLKDRLVIEVYLPDGSMRTATNENQARQLLNDLRST
jgi:hypothetical protein